MSKEQKVVIVTGASQGLGAGFVKAFRERGHKVVATSRSIQPSTDPNIVTVAGDIGDPATAERVVNAAIEKFGRVDTLVNNAGIFTAKPFVDFTLEDYNNNLSTNLHGFFHITQRAATQMLKQKNGHIVSISTTIVDQPMRGVPAALASITKGAINAATRSLAIEFSDQGIRVNAVAPGIIKTPMHAPETHDFLSKLHPLGRMGETSEIVDAVLYLDSAEFVTGEVLHVDGGQHAGKW